MARSFRKPTGTNPERDLTLLVWQDEFGVGAAPPPAPPAPGPAVFKLLEGDGTVSAVQPADQAPFAGRSPQKLCAYSLATVGAIEPRP